MRKIAILSFLFLVCASVGLFSQYSTEYSQPFPGDTGNFFSSSIAPSHPADYEVTDNFSGVTEPITKLEFYGSMGVPLWTPVTPNPFETFKVRFYEYSEEWTTPPSGDALEAPETGTYTVLLIDSYGDGWNGAALDVLVNGIPVLEGITLATGFGPEPYTFDAETGDLVTTTYYNGSWDGEVTYEIWSPGGVHLATDGPNPEGIGTPPPTPLIAPLTGEYTLHLVDSWGDGWNGGSLSLYINSVEVLSNLTIETGSLMEYLFTASAGDEICTVYRPGEYANENEYYIYDPVNNLIASEGTGGATPDNIGFISTVVALEPDWTDPLYEFDLPVITSFVSTLAWGGWDVYKFEAVFPDPVNMLDGWVSVQNSAPETGDPWFLWAAADPVDNLSYIRIGAAKSLKKAPVFVSESAKDMYSYDMCFELFSGAPAGIVIDENGDSDNPTVNVLIGGDIPPELFGADTGVPAVVYTVVATGVHDVVVTKPPAFPSDWYCWLQVGGILLPASNPIPAMVPFWTFPGIDFDAKGDVVIVINDNSTLPVGLSSFTATLTAEMFVELAWVAESETNHSGYNVLRGTSEVIAEAIMLNPSLITEGTATGSQMSYIFSDLEVESQMEYYYWLQSVDLSGETHFFGPIIVRVSTEPDNPGVPEIPLTTSLLNAFPNPFNPSTTIGYYMLEAGDVRIDIYNLRGQLMKSFDRNHIGEGTYYVSWDGRDPSGQPAASGVYFYRMTSGRYSSTKKMVLSK